MQRVAGPAVATTVVGLAGGGAEMPWLCEGGVDELRLSMLGEL